MVYTVTSRSAPRPLDAYGRASNFISASSQRFRMSSTPVTTYPFSISCWIWMDSIDGGGNIPMSVTDDTASTGDFARFVVISSGAVYVQEFTNSTLFATTTKTIHLGEWNHLVGVFVSASERHVYLNGYYDAGSNTTSHTAISGLDHIDIGCTDRSGTITAPFNGDIAHACIWSVALTQAGAAAMYRGDSPRGQQAPNIEAWWPLTEDWGYTDVITGSSQTMSPTNSPGWGRGVDILAPSARVPVSVGGGATPAFPFRRRQPRPRITDWWGDQVHVTTPYSVGGWH